MSYNYKKTYVPQKGYTPVCKIGECSLKKLEFGIIELDAGESHEKIRQQILMLNPMAEEKTIRKFILGK